MRTINSPVFGEVKIADNKERINIENAVSEFPLDTFQALNKSMNKRGYCIMITLLEEIKISEKNENQI